MTAQGERAARSARGDSSSRVLVGGRQFSEGFRDILEGVRRWRVWTTMAMEDLRRRYHRAALGVLWIFLSFFAFVFVKAVVFDRFAGDIDFSFPIYLACGFLVWQFMSGVVGDGADVFVVAANWLQGVPMPLSSFVYQSIVRNLVTASYASMVVVLLIAYEGHSLTWGALLAVPGVIVLALTGVWVQLLLGTVATRYRDVKHLVQTVMRVAFFLTPVLWVPSVMGRLGAYTYWNPFANYLEIVRMPLLHGTVDPFHWIYVGCFTAVGVIVSVAVFTSCRNRIVYWL